MTRRYNNKNTGFSQADKGFFNYPLDSRYPASAYMPQTQDDFIDFPVSPTWRNYYFEQGMSPKPAPRISEFPDSTEPVVEKLEGIKRALEQLCRLLKNQRPETAAPTRPKHVGGVDL